MCVLPLELGAVFQSWLVLPCVSSGTQPEVLPKRASWEHASKDQFGVLGLERARPKRLLRGSDVPAKKNFKKMMAEFPEIKLVKLLIIALREKNTLMKRNCVGQTFIVYCSKAATLQQKSNLFKLFSTDVSWWISLVFKLYFSSASNNVQLNYKFLSCISHFLSTSKLMVPCVSSRTHPKK